MKKVQAIAPLAALFTSLLLFNVEADTYVFHFAVWALALAVVTTSFERRATRILGINLTLLSLLLLIFEVVLIAGEISNRTPAHGVSSEEAPEFRHHHPILGVAPLPDRTYEVKKSWGDEVLFDVRYTIDQHGFRVTPPPRSPDAPAIVFTGCSITFGEGLNDSESYPYRVAELLDRQFRICNLAFSGYGIHQTLANFQHEVYRGSLQNSPPVAVVHLAIPDHPNRSAGALSWGQKAPRYLLNNGRPELRGTFEESATTAQRWRHLRLKESEKSALGRRLLKYRTRPEDVDLWIQLLKASRAEFQAKYPETEFHVVFLNYGGPSTPAIERALKESDLQYHLVFEKLPDFSKDKYMIPIDRHPNALGAQALAEYMLSEVLGDYRPGSRPAPRSIESK